MAKRLTQKIINSIQAADKPQYIADGTVPGLRLYVGTTGKKTWYLLFYANDKRVKHKIGDASIILPEVARDRALDLLRQVAK
jgi:hypothetical protein